MLMESMSTESSGCGRGYKPPSPATESCAISMSHVHFFKMEEKRLTADRYPLHFEVLGLYPIPVGEMQRWAATAKPGYSKAFGSRRRLLFFLHSNQFMIVPGFLLSP